MTPQARYSLAALCYGPAHGYAIYKQVVEMCNGTTPVTSANLYGSVLPGLVKKKLAQVKGGKYTITEEGITLLKIELISLEQEVGVHRNAIQHTEGNND